MALTWVEDGDSRQATIVRKGKKATSSYKKSWKVFGTKDDAELHADINSKIAASYAYWQYPGVSSMQLRAESYSVSYLGDDAWQVQVDYVKDGAEYGTDPLKRSRSFDTTGGTQHITQCPPGEIISGGLGGVADISAQTEFRYPSSAPDQSSAIGVDDDGVKGVDVVVPQLQWTETYDVPDAYVTGAYIKNVSALTGKVNKATFRTFAAGEVLFVGCTGSQEWDDDKGKGPWSLSYRFVASPNVTGQKIGDITGIDKNGHQYLWVRYETAPSGNSLIKKPKYVYVNTVYGSADFNGLGIGTS